MLRFTILGPVSIRHGDAEAEIGGRQPRVVLALLLSAAGSSVSVSEIVDTLWEEDPPLSAVNVVHRFIGMLRRVIEPDLPVRTAGNYIVRSAAGYRLRADAQTLDLLRFRALAGQARQTVEPDGAIRLYAEALRLWQGPSAAGLETVSRIHPAFLAIDAECSLVAREAADLALRHGLLTPVIPALRRAARLSPLDEALQARLVLALAADGRQSEAMATFHAVRRRLDDELGIDPSPELLDAYERLLHQRALPPSAPADRPSVPMQLPADHPFFSGRAAELVRARALLGEDQRQARPIVALAIDGMPGVGKTTFAVHLGHQLTADYPDGQLYADLRGFSDEGAAMAPAEALRGFLASLGVPLSDLPPELHALAGLYRSILANRRMLILLDNCRDYDQVRHLLPSTPGSLAIVTSRTRLTGLISSGSGQPLPLDLPDRDEARTFLARRLGGERVTIDHVAVDTIVDRSGRLPLALALVAARAAMAPGTPLAEIAAELAPAQDFVGFGPASATHLRAVFSWSYRALTAEAARLFRLLPLHPGPDLTVLSAGALAGVDTRTGAHLLGELTSHLMVQDSDGRYQVHGLLRAYAEYLSERHDAPAQRRAATLRVFAYYQHSAHAAHLRLDPQLPEPVPAPADVTPLQFRTQDEAMAWFTAERQALTDVVRTRMDDARGLAWRTALTMQDFLHSSGRTPDWVDIAHAGLDAATLDGDVGGQARLLRSRAGALFMLRDFGGALRHLRRARRIVESVGDDAQLAAIDINAAYVRGAQRRYADAVGHGEHALAAYRRLGDVRNQAAALRVIAANIAGEGRRDEAVRLLREALTLSNSVDDTRGAGHCWDLLGTIHRQVGDRRSAVVHWHRAAANYRRAGAPAARAAVLLAIGDLHEQSGDRGAGRAAWIEARAALGDSAGPLARVVQSRLVVNAPLTLDPHWFGTAPS
ncbi:AfsR/SARP family transcriptional regulator [Cryptosporangium arvum]|uniref:DNA-binding transcriptional activator of the SARP family n=1 Tax=Cryptosporangium arvum DSM 44712 TaxID=927661 RepID=A0A010YPD2_9ACTN|nr:BTAD domain-containing putative transcriptional regulator [Cryptosporangium arvum]EXG82050.1 DNA-binding transcriptional activator of the SARP family [Cryptosporangium arvum DSM 44712]